MILVRSGQGVGTDLLGVRQAYCPRLRLIVPHRKLAGRPGLSPGLEFNNPLVARNIDAHSGAMPKRWGLLEVSSPT